MPRKLTGSGFAIVLIAIIAVKHVALGFCLCTHEYFVSDCPCTCATLPTSSCCPCEEEESPAEEPCRDCSVPVSLDVGDFLWAADTFSLPAQTGPDLALAADRFHDQLPPGRILSLKDSIRGAPPAGPPPHLLRTTVLRL